MRVKKHNKNKINKMKNTVKEAQSVVGVFSVDGKYKGVSRPKMYEGEKYIWKENEMIFYLRENPNCQVQAVGIWCENTIGEVIGDVDTYFIHILTGRRCNTVRDCATGWLEREKKAAEEWELLCQHIEDLRGIEEIICTEKRVEV